MIVKLSGTVLVVLSVVAILCTGCARPTYEPLDDSSVLTEEEEWAALIADSSAFVSPALIDGLRSQAWHIGPEVYYFKYKEPGVMEDTGMFYGLTAGFTSRYWLPASPEEQPWESKWMGRVEGRFAFGTVDYDGALQDGTPMTLSGIHDYVLEGRLLLGPDFPNETSMLSLFTGIGYRYLNDDSSFDPAGYQRESNYLYLPVAVEILALLNDGWSCGASAEFDFFLWGLQKSHLSDVGGADVDKRQNNGYGARASVKLQKKGDKVDLIIEPFIRYWDIGQSDTEMGWIEPMNHTIEVGIRFVLIF
ncbi:MAG: hypothetical protein KAT11_00795 [Phycisphaerae bacterium]|nr:hypothetical protein [Phycisphaerae bacterium]